MFGRGSKKWDEETAQRGLSPVDDPAPWIGAPLYLTAPETTRTSQRRRLTNPGGEPIHYEWRRTTEILRAAANTSLSGPGLLAAAQVKTSELTTSPNSLHHRGTTVPKNQVVVGRLSRPVAGHLLVSPHYTPKTFDGLQDAFAAVAGADAAPPLIEHPLLQYWYFDVSGGDGTADWVVADEALSALLWTLRAKVSGAKDHVPELSARYESLIPETNRMYESATIEVSGDLIACFRQQTGRGLDDKLADQVAHVTQHFR